MWGKRGQGQGRYTGGDDSGAHVNYRGRAQAHMSVVDPWQARCLDWRTSRKFTRARTARAPKQHRHDLPISDSAPHTSANCPQCLNPNAPRTTPSARTSSSSAQSRTRARARTRTSTAPPLRFRAQLDRMAHSYDRYVQISTMGVMHQLNVGLG